MIDNKLFIPVTRILSSPTYILLKRFDILSQKYLCCKKGEAKKVQVAERPKDVVLL